MKENKDNTGSPVSTAVGAPVATAQKDFEDWAFEEVGLNTAKDVDGSYESPETWKAWRAWQEATVRASTSRLAAPTRGSAPTDEVLSLHRQIAAEKLRADQGWERAEAKSRECIELRERMAQVSAPQASAAQEVRAVPEGWKLVPMEATEDMIQAACLNQPAIKPYKNYEQWWDDHTTGTSERIRHYVSSDYRAMIAVAPDAPASTSTAPAAMDEGDAK